MDTSDLTRISDQLLATRIAYYKQQRERCQGIGAGIAARGYALMIADLREEQQMRAWVREENAAESRVS